MQSWFAATLVVLSTFEIQAWIPYLPGLPAVARSAKVRVRFEPIQIDVQSKPDRSVWHGVYTEAQQKRGEPFYVRECSTCHGETLKGGEGTPALTGAEFLDRWNGRTVGDLFENIRKTMPPPPDRPGKLTPQETVDVIAYILEANRVPAAADTQLPADVAQLKQIRITANPPR
jgi:S-disulfanyl-L-cysteine oxidoreductase SoxD